MTRQQHRKRKRFFRRVKKIGTSIIFLCLVTAIGYYLSTSIDVQEASNDNSSNQSSSDSLEQEVADPPISTDDIYGNDPTPEHATPSPTPSDIFEIDTSWIDPDKPIVAFTFDDGPNNNTNRILDTLEEYNAHATFFVLGSSAERFPEEIERIQNNGCTLGNHSYNHDSFLDRTNDDIDTELNGVNDFLNNNGRKQKKYLVRPPYGSYDDDTQASVDAPMIMWSVASEDWSSDTTEEIIENTQNIRDGDIVLFHDIYSKTADAIDVIVPDLISKGYQIVSVEELYAVKGRELTDGSVFFGTYLKAD